jgi:hypothetical protein
VTELVLAFDAACARCRAVAAALAGTGLEVLPLRDYRVVDWCAEAGVAGDVPTLLEIIPTDGDDRVRAFTGPGLLRRLGRLGPRRAVRVVAALRAHGVLTDAARGVLRTPSPARGA